MIPVLPLRLGDTIGIYSPSSGIETSIRENYERGKKALVEYGFKVVEAPHTFEWQAHYSAPGEIKNADLLFLLERDDVKAILPSVGGTTAYQMLDGFPYEKIASARKLIFGYSDNSLQTAIATNRTGLVTFFGHSDVAFGVGDLADPAKAETFSRKGEYTRKMFCDALLGEIKSGPVAKATTWCSLRNGSARGKLIGGDLDVLQILHGTDHELDFDGAIFFWEACDLELHRVDLILAGYKLAGLLQGLAGMVVGKSEKLTETFFEEKHETFEEIILRQCDGYDFPIIVDADIGHDMECAMLPQGVQASIEGDDLILLDDPYER